MSPQPYYTHPDTRYPEITLAILERLRLYYCTMLYPDEEYEIAKNRFILTDITPNMALRSSINVFKLSNAKFPFTAYSIGDFEEDTTRFNTYAKTQNYFSTIHNARIHATPIMQTFPMITFFTTAKDYDRAKIVLLKDKSLLTKLEVPIIVNNVLTSFVILIDIEVTRGSYAGEFEQQLTAGNIYDLVHTNQVFYHSLELDIKINLVDDIVMAMYTLDSLNKISKTYVTKNPFIPEIPIITSTSPVDKEVDVDVSSSIIINFNIPMKEVTIENSLHINPPVNADLLWNSTSTQIVVDLYENMTSGTTYNVTIENTALSGDEIPIEKDYIFSFTTRG